MKIALWTDMEGVAGVTNFKDWIDPTGRYYEEGKRLTTEEANAAIRGFFDAGADEIVVIDAHGFGAINPSLLDERALYSRGWAKRCQFGLNDHFDAMAWVGQHAKAGTILSHLTHTNWLDVLEHRLNGVSVGEFGIYANIAGFYGTSSIFASGERALTEEAKALVPHIHTVEVKYGVSQTDGKDCTFEQYWDHALGAVHVHPNVARKRIYQGARTALEDFIRNRDKYPPTCTPAPYTMEIWYRAHKDRPARKHTQFHESDIVECLNTPGKWTEYDPAEFHY